MKQFDSSTVDRIAQHCLDLFSKLPKSGKPINEEWTVLACVIKHDAESEDIEVVSLGTGSKCIGATKMSSRGDILNDSHAEVIARRGFLLYLYDNIDQAIENKKSIFTRENNRFKLKENIQFIFYSSQLPCGDASIIPKTGEEEQFGDTLKSNKRHAEQEFNGTNSKKMKYELYEDIHRTGAKCLLDSHDQDMKEPGTKYHFLGQVRTKPGRGDKTLSVSCSDKMARWVHVGIQGALLDMLLVEPLYMKQFVFGAGTPFSIDTLKRAILNREPNCPPDVTPFLLPNFYQSTLPFPFIRGKEKIRPAPGSIIWIKRDIQCFEVAVQGGKLGATKKNTKLNNILCICKLNLYKHFLTILHKNVNLKQSIYGDQNVENIPYNKMKRKAIRYIEKWSTVKSKFFKMWTVKPDIWNFCTNVT